MFKIYLQISLFISLLIHVSCNSDFPKLPPELQKINFEQYLRNERLVKFQLKCILYNGPCDSIGKALKRQIPIFLKTQCKSCTDEQKTLAKKFILFLQGNYLKEWNDAVIKYGKDEYTLQEIDDFEKLLGVKIFIDKNGATPSKKPDIDQLVDLVQQAKEQAAQAGVISTIPTTTQAPKTTSLSSMPFAPIVTNSPTSPTTQIKPETQFPIITTPTTTEKSTPVTQQPKPNDNEISTTTTKPPKIVELPQSTKKPTTTTAKKPPPRTTSKPKPKPTKLPKTNKTMSLAPCVNIIFMCIFLLNF